MHTHYARVDRSGDVVQWPVLEAHIRNRGLPARFFEQVIETRPPAHDRLTHSAARRKPVRDERGRLVQAWEVTPRTLEAVRATLMARLADHRWRKETGGVQLQGGQTIKTTREAQAQISSTYSALQSGLVQAADWKAEGGWVAVTLAEFEPIAQAVATHVQRCFTAEKAVAEMLVTAATVDELAQISVAQEFAAAYESSSS